MQLRTSAKQLFLPHRVPRSPNTVQVSHRTKKRLSRSKGLSSPTATCSTTLIFWLQREESEAAPRPPYNYRRATITNQTICHQRQKKDHYLSYLRPSMSVGLAWKAPWLANQRRNKSRIKKRTTRLTLSQTSDWWTDARSNIYLSTFKSKWTNPLPACRPGSA